MSFALSENIANKKFNLQNYVNFRNNLKDKYSFPAHRKFGLFDMPGGIDDWHIWYNNATFDWIS